MCWDVLITVALVSVMVLLANLYTWFIYSLWTGMASIGVAIMSLIIGIIASIIAGALVNRLYVIYIGILALWAASVLYDWATSTASLVNVAMAGSILASLQLTIMGFAWWIASKIREGNKMGKRNGR